MLERESGTAGRKQLQKRLRGLVNTLLKLDDHDIEAKLPLESPVN